MGTVLRRSAAFFVVLVGAACAQDPGAPAAVLDPTGTLAFEHDGVRYELRFPELEWPGTGTHALGEKGLEFGVVGVGGFSALAGTVDVRELGAARAELTVRCADGERGAAVIPLDALVELRRVEPPTVRGAPGEIPHPAPMAGQADDLVFCAIGSAGTGLPGQRRVAASIERLAKEEGLDFVLLLGDQLAPDGVAARDDSKWRSRFEDVYPASRLALPFWLALGDAEHRGDLEAMLGYTALSPRLSIPRPTYEFTRDVGAAQVTFLALDTRTIAGSVRMAPTRRARAVVAQALEASAATWRFAFGHDPMYTHAEDGDRALATELRDAVESWFDRFDVDVYIAGGVHALELIEPKAGVLQINSGGGGGAEVARSVVWSEDTLFAATGGGSVWFRVRPELLEITFRGVDGEVLFVHLVEDVR